VPSQSAAPAIKRTPRKKRKRRFSISKFWPNARRRRRGWRAFRRLSPTTQAVVALAAVFTLWIALNWAYQVFRKPSELLFPVSGALYKTPYETWREYGSLFREHATNVITPDLLAALAQLEASGNPVARTYWRWSLRRKPFEMYRPASSAVWMYQITDGTFAEARRYCIRDHVVVEDGPWNEPHSCWFNRLYTRTLPKHAVELTSAYLDRGVANTLKRIRINDATLQQKQDLAAVIHLCGAGAGEIYARRRFRLVSGQRCGDHDVKGYVARVDEMKRVFKGLDARDSPQEGTGRRPYP
jgi:hypothetical protein